MNWRLLVNRCNLFENIFYDLEELKGWIEITIARIFLAIVIYKIFISDKIIYSGLS